MIAAGRRPRAAPAGPASGRLAAVLQHRRVLRGDPARSGAPPRREDQGRRRALRRRSRSAGHPRVLLLRRRRGRPGHRPGVRGRGDPPDQRAGRGPGRRDLRQRGRAGPLLPVQAAASSAGTTRRATSPTTRPGRRWTSTGTRSTPSRGTPPSPTTPRDPSCVLPRPSSTSSTRTSWACSPRPTRDGPSCSSTRWRRCSASGTG